MVSIFDLKAVVYRKLPQLAELVCIQKVDTPQTPTRAHTHRQLQGLAIAMTWLDFDGDILEVGRTICEREA